MSVRTAVVLAAGEGTRLRPLTHNRPKPMLPAGNRPILEHVLDALVDAGIDSIVMVVGYRRERVQEHFGPTYRGVTLDYAIQEKQLGSGHALVQAREAVSGPLLVVNGDRLIETESVRRVIDTFRREGVPTMAVIEQEDASKYGVVELHDRDVSTIVEKPDTGDHRLINAGIYAFNESVFDEIDETPRDRGELALPDTLRRMLDTGRIRGVTIDGAWVDATYPWDVLEVASEVLSRGWVEEPQDSEAIWISDDARIDDTAVLRPPTVVGSDCEIGPGAVVGPTAALGYNSTVGANATVQRVVLDADTRVGHGSTLIDAVLGQDVGVGVDVTVPGGPGDVRVESHVHEDERLGAVLADRTRVGGAVTFGSGTLVGTGVTVHAGAHVSGVVPDGSEVVR